ncbi:hypothetical protein B566_EDAN003001 [Ephemera danica]|nr:hypothetical protein B566_EDAN003001 [Ephemera danica]
MWRLARAYYKLSKTATNEKERQEFIKEGALHAEKAVAFGPDLPVVHVWYCVLIDARSKFEGFESRIATVLKARQHLMRAVELDPMDVTALHMLALWCYEASVVPWYQRKIASAFATLPNSSYEESLELCKRAQKAYSPKCFSPNLLLMGKIYDKLGEREVAVELLKRAKNCPGHTEREQNANIEAAVTLKNWGIKM